MLDRDTDLSLDSAQHQITLNSGRFLIKTTKDAASWKITVGATSCVCLPDSEIEFSFLETIGVNVLKGSAQLAGPKPAGEPIVLNAAVKWMETKLSDGRHSPAIVEIIERRLREGEKLDAILLNRLATAYESLGRESDRIRAATQNVR